MLWIAARLDPADVPGLLAEPARIDDVLDPDADDVLDLDKAWHGVHMLINGDIGDVTTPAGAAFFGGEAIGPDGGDADGGYGPARLLRPELVQDAARALHELDLLQLLSRYDPVSWDADGVYPSGWAEGDEHAYLLPALQQLREFLTAAARAGQAVVSSLI
jgi:hypothetical protein